MEKQRDDEQTDYWLVQYQRLLDSKPQALIDRVRLKVHHFYFNLNTQIHMIPVYTGFQFFRILFTHDSCLSNVLFKLITFYWKLKYTPQRFFIMRLVNVTTKFS